MTDKPADRAPDTPSQDDSDYEVCASGHKSNLVAWWPRGLVAWGPSGLVAWGLSGLVAQEFGGLGAWWPGGLGA